MSETKGKYDVDGPVNEILSARTTLGLTRRGMARALGMTVRAIQSYEKGDYAPSQRTMRDVNKLLDEAKEQRMAKEIGVPFTKPMSAAQPTLPFPTPSPAPAPTPAPIAYEPTPTEIMNRIAKLERLILAWFGCDSKDYQPSRQ
jgi:DNA-binding XRE family transcriptional regulator